MSIKSIKKKTKIVATISDLRCDKKFITQLFKAGMNVARLNTAHQSVEATRIIVQNIRAVSEKIAIMIDTKGPELRLTKLEEPITVKKDDKFFIQGGSDKLSEGNNIFVNYDRFAAEVPAGSRILIDDGEIEFLVTEKKENQLVCRATNNGILESKKSINVPKISFRLPALNEKDKQYIQFAIEEDIDFIAHSFVRNKEDLLEIQNIFDEQGSNVKIISKIENYEGVKNIQEIIEHSYGIMVARGDLAIEIPYEKIPGVQKTIIKKCIDARKPVIIATQMLHSMISNPRPTRAEVSDIANAIYSKADAVMLSGETTFGEYPVKAVETMSKVAAEVEKSRSDMHKTSEIILSTEESAYLAKSAVEASIKLKAKAIIADTALGRTIRNIAGYRGRKIVYAQCYDKRVMRELSLSFGIYAHYMEPHEQHEFVNKMLNALLIKGCLKESDKVVVLGGNFGLHHGASFVEISTVKCLLDPNAAYEAPASISKKTVLSECRIS